MEIDTDGQPPLGFPRRERAARYARRIHKAFGRLAGECCTNARIENNRQTLGIELDVWISRCWRSSRLSQAFNEG
jgi:hypothetical protein